MILSYFDFALIWFGTLMAGGWVGFLICSMVRASNDAAFERRIDESALRYRVTRHGETTLGEDEAFFNGAQWTPEQIDAFRSARDGEGRPL